jgi:DNA-binding NarL/FixJ family response regulator
MYAGARGYLLKSDANRELIAAIGALVSHKPFFTTQVSETLLRLRPSLVANGVRPRMEPTIRVSSKASESTYVAQPARGHRDWSWK